MKSMKPFALFVAALLVCCGAATDTRAADTTAGAATKGEETNSVDPLRAYLQLQEQIHANELAIDRSQKQAEQAAERTAQALEERLRGIEQALNAQRTKELEVMQNANRVMVIVAGAFAGVGLLAMVVMAYFQWRTVNRLAEISTALPAARGLGAGTPLPALGPGEGPMVTVGPAEQSSQRLLGALEQLEKRLEQIEHAERPSLSNGNGSSNELSLGMAAPNGHGAANGEGGSEEQERLKVLIGKGQSLLNLDNAEGALGCFQEVLAVAPQHTDALLKKGAALEKLRKFDEAIACYDQALAIDGSLAIAHLHKGGLLNRMERFDEALQCYERALRTQEKQVAV